MPWYPGTTQPRPARDGGCGPIRSEHAEGLQGVSLPLPLLQEPAGLGPAIIPQLLQELRPPIELRNRSPGPDRDDARRRGSGGTWGRRASPGEQPVDHLDEPQLLLHRQVAGQLVAAVEDLVRLGRYPGAGAGVDLNEPELVDVIIREVVDRRVLGVEPVPVDAPAGDRDRPEELGDRRGGEQALDARARRR